jgi:hypothetical protein
MMLLLLSMVFHYVNIPVVTMREAPSETARVASQALYSEEVRLLEQRGEWVKIQTPDAYAGWIRMSALHTSPHAFPANDQALIARINRCAAHLYSVKDTEYGPVKTLPFESRMEVVDQFNDPQGRWLQVRLVDDTLAYVQRGDIALSSTPLTKTEMLAFSHFFLGLPYVWGGRSSFGYDCSGFTQMLYRQMGIAIPRDSKDQCAWEGFQEVDVNAVAPGDLLFFGRSKGVVSHVGLYLGEGNFIHSTVGGNKPYIQISNLSDPHWNETGPFINRLGRTLKK